MGGVVDLVARVLFAPGLVVACLAYTLSSFIVVDMLFAIVKGLILLLGMKSLSKQISALMIRCWISVYIFHMERFGGLTLEVYGDEMRPEENALIVCNHRTWMDSTTIFALARQCNRDGDLKFLAKQSLLFFPVYGLGSYLTETCVFIKRTFEEAKESIKGTFDSLVDPASKRPFYIVTYCEGTRLTKKKLEESRGFAKKRDLPVLNNILLPRTKGFGMIVNGLDQNLDALYDVTIGYQNDSEMNPLPTFIDILTLFSFGKKRYVKVHIRRVPMSDVPRTETKMKGFLYNMYSEKDRLLEGLRSTGKFPGKRLPWKKEGLLRPMLTYLVVVGLALVSIFFSLVAFIIISESIRGPE